MADEAPQTDAYAAMIADLKVKRDLIDQAIAEAPRRGTRPRAGSQIRRIRK